MERETGLGKDTLRAWERRYGFPLPQRDASGIRGYPRALVERLALIRRALLTGQRPGRLLTLPAAELDALLARIALHPADIQAATPIRRGAAGTGEEARIASPRPLDIADCLAALRVGGSEALRHWLTRGLARMGLGPFVTEGVAPLTVDIGAAWLSGSVAVYEEHLYSEAIQSVLRNGMLPFQAGLERSAPRVLLTTVPGEQHGLGLLMAEALMTLEACRCLPLGVQTPIADIVAACRAHHIDVVAVSFSESLMASDALAALGELRACLPPSVRLWAGGGASVLRDLRMNGIQVLPGLVHIGKAVASWREDSSATVD